MGDTTSQGSEILQHHNPPMHRVPTVHSVGGRVNAWGSQAQHHSWLCDAAMRVLHKAICGAGQEGLWSEGKPTRRHYAGMMLQMLIAGA